MAIATQSIFSARLAHDAYLAEGEIARRYDIIEGVRHYMRRPKWQHQRITDNLTQPLRQYELIARREDGKRYERRSSQRRQILVV